jgi:hypothetical protein
VKHFCRHELLRPQLEPELERLQTQRVGNMLNKQSRLGVVLQLGDKTGR